MSDVGESAERTLDPADPLALAVTEAIQSGDLESLRRMLGEHPWLAGCRLGSTAPGGMTRSLLHVATDWPGHFPDGAQTVRVLVEAGADVHARFTGPHAETSLHWAASSDDVAVLDALLDAGADIEASGSVIGGGTPMADAVAFGQWRAARRLLQRGAATNLWQAAALGLIDTVRQAFEDGRAAPTADEVTQALWLACHGGQQDTAAYLLQRGGELDWVGFDGLTPLDAARRSGADGLAAWLVEHGAKPAH